MSGPHARLRGRLAGMGLGIFAELATRVAASSPEPGAARRHGLADPPPESRPGIALGDRAGSSLTVGKMCGEATLSGKPSTAQGGSSVGEIGPAHRGDEAVRDEPQSNATMRQAALSSLNPLCIAMMRQAALSSLIRISLNRLRRNQSICSLRGQVSAHELRQTARLAAPSARYHRGGSVFHGRHRSASQVAAAGRSRPGPRPKPSGSVAALQGSGSAGAAALAAGERAKASVCSADLVTKGGAGGRTSAEK
jgi:hypothetical protein